MVSACVAKATAVSATANGINNPLIRLLTTPDKKSDGAVTGPVLDWLAHQRGVSPA
jgi:hypothetical protein